MLGPIACKWKQLLSTYSHLQPLKEVKVQKKNNYLYQDDPCLTWEMARPSSKINCTKAHKDS